MILIKVRKVISMENSIGVTRAGATNIAESVGTMRRHQAISRQTLILRDGSRIGWFGARCPYTGRTSCRDRFLILWLGGFLCCSWSRYKMEQKEKIIWLHVYQLNNFCLVASSPADWNARGRMPIRT